MTARLTDSQRPIQETIWREVVHTDGNGVVHLTIAEHAPRVPFLPRRYLHLHAHDRLGRKPAALNARQLRRLIDKLEVLLREIALPGELEPGGMAGRKVRVRRHLQLADRKS